MRISVHPLAMFLLPAIVAGCSSTLPADIPARPLRLEIQAGKIAEDCFALAEGERIEYRFEATNAVDFNLHTHRGREIVMPVDVKRTRAQSGTYASPSAEEYCLTWTNAGAVPVHVTGEWKRLQQ